MRLQSTRVKCDYTVTAWVNMLKDTRAAVQLSEKGQQAQ